MDKVRIPSMYAYYRRQLIAALDSKTGINPDGQSVAAILSDMPDDIKEAIVEDHYEEYGPTIIWRN